MALPKLIPDDSSVSPQSWFQRLQGMASGHPGVLSTVVNGLAKLNNDPETSLGNVSTVPAGASILAFRKAAAEHGSKEFGSLLDQALAAAAKEPKTPIGGYFIGQDGKAINIGKSTHEQYLLQNGLMPPESERGMSPLATALGKNKLIRVRDTPERLALEMAHPPNPDQLTAIINRLSMFNTKPIVMDLWKKGDILSKAYKSGAEALHDLLNFF